MSKRNEIEYLNQTIDLLDEKCTQCSKAIINLIKSNKEQNEVIKALTVNQIEYKDYIDNSSLIKKEKSKRIKLLKKIIKKLSKKNLTNKKFGKLIKLLYKLIPESVKRNLETNYLVKTTIRVKINNKTTKVDATLYYLDNELRITSDFFTSQSIINPLKTNKNKIKNKVFSKKKKIQELIKLTKRVIELI